MNDLDDNDNIPADGTVTVAHDGATIHGSDTVDEAAAALFDAFGGDYCMELVQALWREMARRTKAKVEKRVDVRSGRSRFVS